MKDLTMEELVAKYNELAAEYGVDPVAEFASLAKGRTAINKLIKANKPKAETNRGPRNGVGKFAQEQLLAGLSNKDVLAAVQANFPESKTTLPCVAYYRTKLIKDGKLESTRKAA